MNANIDPRFWDRIARRYAEKPVSDEEAYQQTLARVRARLTPDANVLEIGCGTGTTALNLSPYAADILATDLSSQMLAFAKEKARTQEVQNVRFACGTLDSSWLKATSFDVVMAFNLIHLLEDIPGSVRRIHDLLEPGGLFISKTPCIGELSLLLRGVLPLMRAVGKAPFVNPVKKDSLQRTIAETGFEILETGLYPAKTKSLYIVARKQ